MDNNNGFCPSSHIVNVRSNNFAGMMASNNDNDDDGTSADICVDFGSEHCFVAVTGELLHFHMRYSSTSFLWQNGIPLFSHNLKYKTISYICFNDMLQMQGRVEREKVS